MFNRLSTVRTSVDHSAISILQVKVPGQFSHGAMHVAEQRIITLHGLGKRDDVAARNDQHVRRRLRIDVGEGNDLVITWTGKLGTDAATAGTMTGTIYGDVYDATGSFTAKRVAAATSPAPPTTS